MKPTATNLPEWGTIDTVLLDMDGTVLDLGFDSYFWQEHLPRRYCETHGVGGDEAARVLKTLFDDHRGTLNWYCLDFWSRELDLDVAALKLEVADRICFLAEAPRFLEGMRRLGKRLLLVTNAHPGSLELKQARTGLGRYFDGMISAHEYGVPKEDEIFWSKLAARERIDPARTLFVDDSLPVLRAARAFGIHWLVAIRRPDSRRPARAVSGFLSVDALHELMGSGDPNHLDC